MPGTCYADLDVALEEWASVVGGDHVDADPASPSAAERSTSATENRIAAIVRPGTSNKSSSPLGHGSLATTQRYRSGRMDVAVCDRLGIKVS